MHGGCGEAEADRARCHKALIKAAAAHQHRGLGLARQLQGQVLGQSDVVVAGQIVTHQGQMRFWEAGMHPIEHLVPEADCSTAIGGAVIDQRVAALGSEFVNTSQGPVRSSIDAEQSSFGLRAVTRGHGDGQRPVSGSGHHTHGTQLSMPETGALL